MVGPRGPFPQHLAQRVGFGGDLLLALPGEHERSLRLVGKPRLVALKARDVATGIPLTPVERLCLAFLRLGGAGRRGELALRPRKHGPALVEGGAGGPGGNQPRAAGGDDPVEQAETVDETAGVGGRREGLQAAGWGGDVGEVDCFAHSIAVLAHVLVQLVDFAL